MGVVLATISVANRDISGVFEEEAVTVMAETATNNGG